MLRIGFRSTRFEGGSLVKQKISALIDAEIVRRGKQRAAEERSVSELVQEALMKYLEKQAVTREERKIAYYFILRTIDENTSESASLCSRRSDAVIATQLTNLEQYTFFVPEEVHRSKIRQLKTNVGTSLNKALEKS